MRALPFLLALAACGSEGGGPVAPDARIDCTIGGVPAAGGCTVERRQEANGIALVLRNPRGGFRRLLVANGEISAADGAERARSARLPDGRIEVAIAGDRFLLPPEMVR